MRATCGSAPSPRNPSPPSESAKITQNVRRRLASFPEVRYVVSQLGRPDDGTDINGWDISEYSVALQAARAMENRPHARRAVRRAWRATCGKSPA